MVLQNSGRYVRDRFKRKDDDGGPGQTDELDPSAMDADASSSAGTSAADRMQELLRNEEMDARYGFVPHRDPGVERTGWLVNMHAADMVDENKRLVSAVDYYFIEEDGTRFKATFPFEPYFYILARPGTEREVSAYLSKRFQGSLLKAETVMKEDLDLANHLVGLKRHYIKLQFASLNDLQKVKRELMPRIRKNRAKEAGTATMSALSGSSSHSGGDQVENMIDIREHDVPYHVRVAIDQHVMVGKWYAITGHGHHQAPDIRPRDDLIDRPDPVVLAFDIETTKLPLKFPDAQIDQIMMISYMIDGQGFLIINREIVSADIDDFEYTPKPELQGNFVVFNEKDEYDTIRRFFDEILEYKPVIIVTYNGDSFDWPFVEARAHQHGLNMVREIGYSKDTAGEYKCRPVIHMDAFRWVKRDSYLPVGSQNLKATAKAKLRYDPVELDPEEMVRMAQEQPQVLANYSVSDAVATYYLYMEYVQPFIFALCTIIPLEPDEVLRKGSGTLCEALLMVQAFHADIIFPNKQETVYNKMTDDGHVMDQETYVGGHVEALESGVFHDKLPYRFAMDSTAYQELIDSVDRTLEHCLVEEEGVSMAQVTNLSEVSNAIKEGLASLRDQPQRKEQPVIYHLDVGAMYPNIILTNRLQPPAIVDNQTCAACDYNKPGATCQRRMTWMWRGEIIPANRSEYQRIVQQLENEKFPPLYPNGPQRAFHQLTREEQATIEKKRLQEYCRRAYKKLHNTRTELRTTTICQRENSFYVDTVRMFRDRRYEYKAMHKNWKKKLDAAKAEGDAAEMKSCRSKIVLYDSLQLAHKCILNSFYGYVMRKGSRWFSMEMAGIVCHTGANIIKHARELIERVGRPLELDTDGIWCMLPSSFPQDFTVTTSHEKKGKISVSYPCALLNMRVKESFTNHQYHELVDAANLKYEVKSENSIFFEVDGPYLAMVLPAAKEEGKRLKKRYAVFNHDHSLAELKGFEVKRRGELELIKIFQSSVFESFLHGSTLSEVYDSAAKVANYWLDVLYSKASNMPDSELFALISERKNMSRKLEDYGGQKNMAISTAKRLAEFLGDQMVKDAGLNCQFIIARKPDGRPVTERAIPLAIFQAEDAIKKHYLRRWLGGNQGVTGYDIREILDWNYYIERLGSAIQKIITIPAAMQGVSNPVPRIAHPDWLHKRLLEKNDTYKQKRITDIFGKAPVPTAADVTDIEQLASTASTSRKRPASPAHDAPSVPRILHRGEDLSVPWQTAIGDPPMIVEGDKKSKEAWIAFQKRKWAYQRRQRQATRRQQQKTATASRSVEQPLIAAGTKQTLREAAWQILQISESRIPGIFNMWILMGSELRQITLRVPRIFYINQRIPKEQDRGPTYRKVVRSLPRCNRVHHLYEYAVEETQYQDNVNKLNAELSVPEIEGIYETNVPLLFRALLRLGCVCRVIQDRRKALSKERHTFNLLDLESMPVGSEQAYASSNLLKFAYLYHYVQDNRMLIGFMTPFERQAHVILVGAGASTNALGDVSALYASEQRKRGIESASQTRFIVSTETTLRQGYRALQRIVNQYKADHPSPRMVAVQTNIELGDLIENAAALLNFPVMRTVIREITSPLFSALDWQQRGAKHLINTLVQFPTVVQSNLSLSRYLRVPLANLPSAHDLPTFGADLCFARALVAANHVLWCSPTDRPDLGGKEVDDNRLVIADEERPFELSRTGCYASVCVELDVSTLPVAAIMQSHRIIESEGVASSVGFDSAPKLAIDEMVGGQSAYRMLSSYDEAALSAQTFGILRGVVNQWVRDVVTPGEQSIFADSLQMHFYRWLRSPDALLFEPALRKTLHGLMEKLFKLLIVEMEKLSAVIIYADLHRIIVCTKKHRVKDAVDYIRFILGCIQESDTYRLLDVRIERVYSFLLWLDPANFGAVEAKFNDEEEEEEENTEENQDSEVVMNWSLAWYLPEAASCQEHFVSIIERYITENYVHLSQLRGADSTGHTPVRRLVDMNASTPLTPMAMQKRADLTKSDDYRTQFSQDLIMKDIFHKFLTIIDSVKKQVSANREALAHGSAVLFPQLPGSHLKMENPALELVKAVYKVLSLDDLIAGEARKLRSACLRMLGVAEFAPQSVWRDPCLTYILPEVLCRRCNFFRTLDLCRDQFLHPDTASESGAWNCPQCRADYDSAEIEHAIVAALNRTVMTFTLQDLQCAKCKEIKLAHMTTCCECAGEFDLTVQRKSNFGRRLKTFSGIARHYNMRVLSETIDHLLTQNAWLEKFMKENF